MNTIKEIQAAIDPMLAMLSAKGKSRPEVQVTLHANAEASGCFIWVKPGGDNVWDRQYEHFRDSSLAEIVAQMAARIEAMPDAATSKLHDFMGQLGKLIDNGRDLGIEVDYLNPLTETMKRLSENIITHQPAAVA
jgi:hypothetical protein